MSKSIIIDAGHGGTDTGANGFGVLEKDWALEISRYQYKRLKELGAKVAMTRKEDSTLTPTERIARIKNHYDVCVSNHWNAYDGKARGIETIHSVHAKAIFAQNLADHLASTTDLPLRRVFKRSISTGVDYYFLHRLTGRTETVIVEYGFIDNKRDFNYYNHRSHFNIAAESVIAGICEKIGIKYQPVKEFEKQSLKNSSQASSSIGKRVESIFKGTLRFYNQPSWRDQDVYGQLQKGQGFPEIIEKIKVGSGEQYKVKNSKGQIFYLTASPTYVKVI